jgi:starch synthase (maltosyl-transferring)
MMSRAAQTVLEPISLKVTPAVKPGNQANVRRVYAADLTRSGRTLAPDFLSSILWLGFDTLLLALPRHIGTADIQALPPIIDRAVLAGLDVHLDLRLDIAGETAHAVLNHPDWYRPVVRHATDPREAPAPAGQHGLDLDTPAAIEAFADYWVEFLRRFGDSGIGGYRCKTNAAVPNAVWQRLIAASSVFHFAVWAPGMPDDKIRQLPRDCFDIAYNSLALWDFGAGWLRDELARLAAVAPVANTIGLPAAPASGAMSRHAAERLLIVASRNGQGLLQPIGFEFGIASDPDFPGLGADDWPRLRDHALIDLTERVRQANSHVAIRTAVAPELLSGDAAPVAVLFEPPAQLTLANRHLVQKAMFDPASILPMLDGKLSGFADADHVPLDPAPIALGPGEVRVYTGTIAHPVVMTTAIQASADECLAAATTTSRVAIEAIAPSVDHGRFVIKRLAGERLTVEADIFADGHGKISAVLQWRAGDETGWQETPMRPGVNDRWSGEILLERVGRYVFRILGWPDRFATWRDELMKKRGAGLDVGMELEEGVILVEAMAAAVPGMLDCLVACINAQEPAARVACMTDDATAAAIARADTRPGLLISDEIPVDADRRAAEFASWYELFPRNQSGDPARHGTFRDVVRGLPAIRDMGFDVLYFPPIHPIGRTNRKGRDNALIPDENDPGSPYAIGGPEGGHDAIHPSLGTLDDFRALRDATASHGMELALDFAIQCSPDHPWLREHPEWFDWRPDGGLRYAENPPKKYEDIVNVDFYRPRAIPGLWLALRDVVGFWANEGVRVFRVDNPHTKPFAFWEWLIADIRARYPDAVFLAEAFTRPKVMYRLAKLGFTQSYTYFTWRNEKWEIEDYLRELTAGRPPESRSRVADFFRPNFFVNTPDINPTFLQHSGRPGFLIRAALAATLSGLWGMLQGFELCEAAPVPGREEYAHSDKYEIRVRPERAPGDIVDEITRLNAIRRANPALQSHRGLALHHAANDQVLWYRKENADRSNVVLVAVSLDPSARQTARVEVPLWEWGLGDHQALIVSDLMRGGTTVWRGKYRTISLDPAELPFGIWRARPLETVG